MRIRKRQYRFTWTAFVSVIFSATLLLILPSFHSLSTTTKAILSFILWGWIVLPSFYLFVTGSRRALVRMIHSSETELSKAVEKPPVGAGIHKGEELNIQGVAGKIVRRTDTDLPPEKWAEDFISLCVSELEIMSAVCYQRTENNLFESIATYAFPHDHPPPGFGEGEGLNGQVAMDRQLQVLRTLPDKHQEVFSGLGKTRPSYLVILPLVVDNQSEYIIEVAGFRWADSNLEQLFQRVANGLAEKLMAREKK